ncbi:hypothetical protein BJV77DRAFT_1033868 [Russula vinacea]|nr:hypothetical protein BJV77DRAFT_1033868 [Russula vinacea]
MRQEGLGADVRIEAERKLKALEADLVVAERTNKERALATRYHKVKFFVRKALKAELFDLRVDLNYVMNYPKLEKYISLYPPEVRSREDGATPMHSDASSSATDEKREKLREWVRGMMRAEELSNEPETLEYKQAVQKGVAQRWEVTIDKNKRVGDSEAGELANTCFSELPAKRRRDKAENHPDKLSKPAEKDPKKARRKKHRKVASPVIIQDSFFGDESE